MFLNTFLKAWKVLFLKIICNKGIVEIMGRTLNHVAAVMLSLWARTLPQTHLRAIECLFTIHTYKNNMHKLNTLHTCIVGFSAEGIFIYMIFCA